MRRHASFADLLLRTLPPLLLVAGCASSPTTAEPTSCAQRAEEIQRAEVERQAAMQQQQTAWKAVLPVAVAARYASGQSATAAADRRLAELRAAPCH